jgi:drug/metabolite transporter (DMT)-like permease
VFLVGYVFTFYHGLKRVRASVATAVLAICAPITSLITIIAQGNVNWSLEKTWGVVLMVAGVSLVIGFNQVKSLLTKPSHVGAS